MSALDLQAADPVTVPLAELRRDEALVCRARGVNKSTVAEYAEAMRGGATFPPVVVFRDPKGTHWLADGFHRTAAAELAGLAEIATDVREGGRREALLHAASANSAHGLRRTNADKRRAVALVLASFPKWSDRRVADACGVSPTSVGKARAQLSNLDTPEREGADGKTRRAPEPGAFDPDKALGRVQRTLRATFDTWPTGDAEGLGRLRVMLGEWVQRLGQEQVKRAERDAKPRPARRSNGAAQLASLEASAP